MQLQSCFSWIWNSWFEASAPPSAVMKNLQEHLSWARLGSQAINLLKHSAVCAKRSSWPTIESQQVFFKSQLFWSSKQLLRQTSCTVIFIAWSWYPVCIFWATFCWTRSGWCIDRSSFNLQTFNPTFFSSLPRFLSPSSFCVICKWALQPPTTNALTTYPPTYVKIVDHISNIFRILWLLKTVIIVYFLL